MGLTNTINPPGGATAVLAATNAQVMALGWMYIPFVMLGSVIMLAIALLINNIQRRYPVYWWTAEELPRRTRSDLLEKMESNDSGRPFGDRDEVREQGIDDKVVVSAGRIIIPEHLILMDEDLALLERLQMRLGSVNIGS